MDFTSFFPEKMKDLKLVIILLAILSLCKEGFAKSYKVIKLVPVDNVAYPGEPIQGSEEDFPFPRAPRFGVNTIQRNPLYLQKIVSVINDGGQDSEADFIPLQRIAVQNVQRSNGLLYSLVDDKHTIGSNKRALEVRSKRRLSINHGLHVLSNILGNMKKPNERMYPSRPRINVLQDIKGNIDSFYRGRSSDKEKIYKAHVRQKFGRYNKAAIAKMLIQFGK